MICLTLLSESCILDIKDVWIISDNFRWHFPRSVVFPNFSIWRAFDMEHLISLKLCIHYLDGPTTYCFSPYDWSKNGRYFRCIVWSCPYCPCWISIMEYCIHIHFCLQFIFKSAYLVTASSAQFVMVIRAINLASIGYDMNQVFLLMILKKLAESKP